VEVKSLPEYSKDGCEMNAKIKQIWGNHGSENIVHLDLKVLDNHTLFNAVYFGNKPVRVTIEEIKN
jgi:hypothetical protein